MPGAGDTLGEEEGFDVDVLEDGVEKFDRQFRESGHRFDVFRVWSWQSRNRPWYAMSKILLLDLVGCCTKFLASTTGGRGHAANTNPNPTTISHPEWKAKEVVSPADRVCLLVELWKDRFLDGHVWGNTNANGLCIPLPKS